MNKLAGMYLLIDCFYITESSKVVAVISMADPVTLDYYGGPNRVTVEYTCAKSGNGSIYIPVHYS